VTATEVAEHFALHPNVAVITLTSWPRADTSTSTSTAATPGSDALQSATCRVPATRQPRCRRSGRSSPRAAGPPADHRRPRPGRADRPRSGRGVRPLARLANGARRRTEITALGHAIGGPRVDRTGFAAHGGVAGSPNSIVRDHCPFGDAAIDHPVLCAADRGLVEGLLNGCAETACRFSSRPGARRRVCATVAG